MFPKQCRRIPSEVIPYLYPSRYCESDMLVRLAQHEFGKLEHGFSRVTAICNWIHDNVEYLRGSTNPLTSAYDTATERAGVCRDFAHLAIAFCRAVSIPAQIRGRLCVCFATAGFPRLLRGLSGRRLVYLRSDTSGPSDRADSRGHRSRRR